jgi:hypothetical protein
MNTDGVSIFESSGVQVWPIFFIINEMAPSDRFCINNVLFCGLYFGESKPSFKVFLQPVVQSMNKLESEGVELYDGSICKMRLINEAADLPAKVELIYTNNVGWNAWNDIAQWQHLHGARKK